MHQPLNLPDRIFALRAALGPRLREPMEFAPFAALLARVSGIEERAPSTLLRWERGGGTPSHEEVVSLAVLAGQDVAAFVYGSELRGVWIRAGAELDRLERSDGQLADGAGAPAPYNE